VHVNVMADHRVGHQARRAWQEKIPSPRTESRILVIGSGGAGKSTFARVLAEKLKLPIIHLDRHFWCPDWQEPDKRKWRQKLSRLAKRRRWVMDGNYVGSFDLRFPRAQSIVYLDFHPLLCLWRVLKRRVIFHGKSRPDLHPGCPEQVDWEFILWIWNFRRDIHPEIMRAARQYRRDSRLIVCKSPAEAAKLLDSL